MSECYLEDEFHDILAKAQEGLNISDQKLIRQARIDLYQLERLRAGHVDSYSLERVAHVLGLCPLALLEIAEHRWRPMGHAEIPGLACFQSPCGINSTVNAYLVWDLASINGICFDTGTNATELLRFAAERKIRVQMVLMTHSHPAHIGALGQIVNLTDARAFIDKLEAFPGAETFEPGRNFRAGNMVVDSRPTPGHSQGSVSYIISGKSHKIAIVGDSLFAGSIGRAFSSYSQALQSNREKLLTLPEETILCPGHGPITTVGEEKLHNPFLADRAAFWEKAA